jgi:hypothetical protein
MKNALEVSRHLKLNHWPDQWASLVRKSFNIYILYDVARRWLTGVRASGATYQASINPRSLASVLSRGRKNRHWSVRQVLTGATLAFVWPVPSSGRGTRG